MERDRIKVYSTILFVVTLLIAVATLLFLNYLMRKRARLEEITRRAAEESAFSPTVFRIYDRSTKRVCDRLIRVMPFDWWIWACRKELYILNPEGGIKCAAGSTPAVQVLATQFVEVCLNLDYDSILSGYTTLPCKIVPYEIDSSVFTILSALNLLVERWITFEPENGNSVPMTRFSRIQEDGSRARREVSAHDLVRRISRDVARGSYTGGVSSHTRLLDRARAVAEKRRAIAMASTSASASSSSAVSITEYQNAEKDEDDARSRVYVRMPVTSK